MLQKVFAILISSERVFLETQLSHGGNRQGSQPSTKRGRSTISREIRRNGWRAKLRKGSIAGELPQGGSGSKSPCVLSVKARRPRKLKAGNQLWRTMLRHLRRGLSPVRDCEHTGTYGWIRSVFPMRPSTPHCMPCHGDSSALACWISLRRRHKARRPARGKNGRKVTPFPTWPLIDRRPIGSERATDSRPLGRDLIIGKEETFLRWASWWSERASLSPW